MQKKRTWRVFTAARMMLFQYTVHVLATYHLSYSKVSIVFMQNRYIQQQSVIETKRCKLTFCR